MMRIVAVLWSVFGLAQAAAACSQDTPCMVNDRAYYVAEAPTDGPEAGAAVVFVHGFGGNGAGALRNRAMVDAFVGRGYTVLAPDGQPRPGGNGRSWNFHPRTGGQMDEINHLMAVKADAVARFGLDADRIILSGFSIGGSMVAYTACLTPEAFSAYAPLGGSFWRPEPETCAGPVQMFHAHGWTDGTVPLEGRVVNGVEMYAPDAFAQGDVFRAMDIFRRANGCTYAKPDRIEIGAEYWQRVWDQCDAGSALRFAVFPRGHIIPRSWPDLVVDWFETL